MPTVSIVMPAYNRERFIPAAIGSILRQTCTDFELIIWDDGSTDRTIEAARKAAGNDPRVRVVGGAHAGISGAINSGAKLATGKYLGTVDSDDALMPTALAETARYLDEHPDVAMVYTDYLAMDEAGNVKGLGNRTKIPYSKDRLLIDFMTFHFRLMRREWFERLGGFDVSMDAAEDYDFCLRLSEQAEIRHLPQPLYLYRVHGNSISTSNRLHQIMLAREAIARALERRGMSRQFEVDVELIGRFRLKKKPDQPA